jgi:hypothetical protein
MTIVTSPAWGIPAAPMEAAVAVMLMAAIFPIDNSYPRTCTEYKFLAPQHSA